MIVRDRERMDRFIRSAKAGRFVSIIVYLPYLKQLVTAYCYDGKALVVPSHERRGVLVTDWSLFMRFIRRHKSWPT